MTRTLVAIAVALSVSGCAVDAEDPLPEPEQKEPQRDPPARSLSGQLQLPQDVNDDVAEDQSAPRPTFKRPLPNTNTR